MIFWSIAPKHIAMPLYTWLHLYVQVTCSCTCVTYCRYGFDYGNVHVVMMSTEHDFTANSEQLQFLDDYLKTVNREKTPWLIFTGHRPMYVDSTSTQVPAGDQPVATLLREHVEPLLKVI